MNIIFKSTNLIDIILSKTQRKTPTIIHQHFSIQRIRQFYIKKLKFIQHKFNDYIQNIIKKFPVLDQIHPFYRDLLNILFDKNQYKIALSRLNNSRNLVTKISAEYVKLIKIGNSLYNCKHLKKTAIGRVCTLIKKINPAFLYLEKIRKQIKAIPSIDPYRKSILLSGCSGSGKSSLLNKITKANVQVDSRTDTTKLIKIGHYTKNFIRWQIIDTPGLKFIRKNKYTSIEMQTMNALSRLDYILCYIFDPTSYCKTNFSEQLDILMMILPLIKNREKIFLLGKTDLNWEKTKNRNKKTLLFYIFKICLKKFQIFKISLHDETGLRILCQKMCDLKEHIVEKKTKQTHLFLKYSSKFNFNSYTNEKIESNKLTFQKINFINFRNKNNIPTLITEIIDQKLFNNKNNLREKKTTNEKEEKIREILYEKKFTQIIFRRQTKIRNIINNLKISSRNSIITAYVNENMFKNKKLK